ncbi:MAG: flagellar biosynthesis anti-sigma factor FlgM [Candidatus Schekmanbacteria bacterium]|nr:flagellar biosynthesis anti-sigma factor FlgM [Candidatus Schekmanbacteria bacterium]
MKIDSKSQTTNLLVGINKDLKKTPKNETYKNDGEVKIAVSETGSKISQYVDIVKKADTTDSQKLSELKRQIETGTYSIKYNEIAEKMIESSLQELSIEKK